MTTEILSDELMRRLTDLEDQIMTCKGTLDEIGRLPLRFDDAIPEGIAERNMLLRRLKGDIWCINSAYLQIECHLA